MSQSRNEEKHHNLKLPVPSLPNGQKPDFGNSSKRKSSNSKHNSNTADNHKNHNQTKNNKAFNNTTSYSKKNGGKPQSQNNNRRPQNSKDQSNSRKGTSPSSAYNITTNLNQGDYKTVSTPGTKASTTVLRNSSSSVFAGSTFTAAPETNSLPKPSFF